VGSTSGDANHADDAALAGALSLPASELPATRSALRRSSVLVALFALSAIVLLVFGGVLRWRQYQMTNLATTGVRATATVDSVESRAVAREHHIIGLINVTYPVGGQPQRARFDVSTHVVQYHEGDKVEVAYDRAHPDQADLVNDPAASRGFVPWELPFAFALVAGFMAGIAIRHLRSYRRVLGSHEWLAVPAIRKPASGRVRGRGTTVVELGEASSPERIVATVVGIRAMPPTIEPIAWVAGWGSRKFVLAPPGGRPLLLMQRLSDVGVDAETDRAADGSSAPLAGDVPHQRHAP
jgi:hypothetical protein